MEENMTPEQVDSLIWAIRGIAFAFALCLNACALSAIAGAFVGKDFRR